jgi:hypothetical protein
MQRVLRVVVLCAAVVVGLIVLSLVGGVALPGLTHPVTLPTDEPAQGRNAPLAEVEPSRGRDPRLSQTAGVRRDAPSVVNGIVDLPVGSSSSDGASESATQPGRPRSSGSVPISAYPSTSPHGGRPGTPAGSPASTGSAAPTTPASTPSSSPGGRPSSAPSSGRPSSSHTRTVGATPTPGPQSTHPARGPRSTHPNGARSTHPTNGAGTTRSQSPNPHSTLHPMVAAS